MSAAIGEPYRLEGKRLAFTSWFHILPAQVDWHDREGKPASVMSKLAAEEALYRAADTPAGIRLEVRRAERTEPIYSPTHPWEAGGIACATLLRDGSVFRSWAATGWGDLESRQKPGLCLYESHDGYHWNAILEGSPGSGGGKTNIVNDHGGFVFIDPAALPRERYKLITEAWISRDECERFRRETDLCADFLAERNDIGRFACVKGAVSPDGVSWKAIESPLLIAHSDTMVTAEYDARLGRYVGYFRSYMMGTVGASAVGPGNPRWIGACRRSIGRAETNDFRRFPVPELSLVPPPSLGPSRVLYTNAKTTMPGAGDHHMMFPSVWDQSNDSTAIYLGVSHDNKTWQLYDEHPVLETGPFGNWDGGCVFASPNLLELPDQSFVLPYVGYSVPHKYPRWCATRASAYARWPKGRLIGIRAEEAGSFSTVALTAPGTHLTVNALVARGGALRIEAVGADNKPIPGRTFADSVPLFGDCHGAPVVWKGHEDIGVAAGEEVRLRIQLSHGSIYSLDFQNSK